MRFVPDLKGIMRQDDLALMRFCIGVADLELEVILAPSKTLLNALVLSDDLVMVSVDKVDLTVELVENLMRSLSLAEREVAEMINSVAFLDDLVVIVYERLVVFFDLLWRQFDIRPCVIVSPCAFFILEFLRYLGLLIRKERSLAILNDVGVRIIPNASQR